MNHLCRFVLLLPALLFLAGGAASAETLLKSVDVNVILEKSRPARDAAAHLEKVRTTLQQGYDALASNQKGLPAKTRQEDLSRALNLLQRQMNIETEAARQIVLGALARVCEQWGRENPTLWLVPRGNVLAAPAAEDVTPEILKRMEDEKVSFPDLPRVTIKNGPDTPVVTPPADAPGKAQKTVPGTEYRAPVTDTTQPGGDKP